MLNLKRRHIRACPLHRQKNGGSILNKCSCPLWAVGTVKGEVYRRSLDTINLEVGRKKLAEREKRLESDVKDKSVRDAAAAFLAMTEVAESSERKYRRRLRFFADHAERSGVRDMRSYSLEVLDAYRLSRPLSKLSWSKELTFLRTFFTFAMERKWCDENIAKKAKMPKDPTPKPVEPFTSEEVIAIIHAAECIGQSQYERSRATAMVQLMNFYALRISDVATLKRDRIKGDSIFLHALKNGAQIWLPLYPEVQRALEALPLPDGASADCEYFFWTGNGSKDSVIRATERTLTSVFRRSGVIGAHAHRFRHTLATRILVSGGTIEDAANVLGDSPAVIRKHYAKYSAEYQHRTVEVMRKVHGGRIPTPVTHEKTQGVNPAFSVDSVVAREGIEPPKGRKN